MDISKQVCTLEQAKRLRQLGVAQQGIWTWVFPALSKMLSTTYGVYHYSHAKEIIDENEGTEFDHDYASAYTVAELGEMLPDYITVDSYRMHPRFYKQEQNNRPALWTATYGKSVDEEVPDFDAYNEAQCRAAMLIHLIENKLITIEQINK